MPITNYRRTEVESESCQNVNYQVSIGLCWRQGTEVGENRGNRVDKQLQTNNTTKHSIKMVLLSGQMMTNAQCTYTDLEPIMIKLSILLFWIAFLILLFWRRKTFESDHTIIARKRDTQASVYWEGKETKNRNPGQDPIDSRPLSVPFLFRTPKKRILTVKLARLIDS